MSDKARRPKICFLSSEHPPYDKRVYEKEARSLAAAGFDVVHLCPDHTPADRPVRDVTVVQYPHRRGKLRRLAGLVDLYRRARAIDADAYHCNEPDSWLVGVALRLAKRKIAVFDCHEHYAGQVMRWMPFGLRYAAAAAIRAYLQVLALASDLVVLAKYSVAGDFSLSAQRTLVVLNTSPLSALTGQLGASPVGERGAGARFRFVHVGVIRRERGSERLLDAIGLLAAEGRRDFSVCIIGEFKDGSRDAFFARAERLGVRDLIEFHEWMPFEAAFAHVRASDAGLVLFQRGVLNNVYGMPHKMFDYMLAGLPVIAPDFAPDIVRVIEDASCGALVDTDSPAAIAAAMAQLMDDRALAQRFGASGRDAVLKRYNWEAEARKLADAYWKLFAPRGFPAPAAPSSARG